MIKQQVCDRINVCTSTLIIKNQCTNIWINLYEYVWASSSAPPWKNAEHLHHFDYKLSRAHASALSLPRCLTLSLARACACVYISIYAHVLYTCKYTCIYIFVYIRGRCSACVLEYMIHKSLHIHIFMYIHQYISLHIYVYKYIHINIHTFRKMTYMPCEHQTRVRASRRRYCQYDCVYKCVFSYLYITTQHINMQIPRCMYYMCIYMYIFVCIVYTHVCVYVYICVYIYSMNLWESDANLVYN